MRRRLLSPSSFRPPGDVIEAVFAIPPFIKKKRYTGRRAQGVRYEKLVQEYLLFRYPQTYLPSPWIRFRNADGVRWCQPDGLLFLPLEGRIIIIEVKYQHTPDAWWQTKCLYMPVIEKIFPRPLWELDVVEVVKWFDPAIAFPERVVLANEVTMRHKDFKVHIWKP